MNYETYKYENPLEEVLDSELPDWLIYGRMSIVAQHAKKMKVEDALGILGEEWDYCPECEEYMIPHCKTVNGRVGSYDSWLPDEDYFFCSECGSELG